MKKAPEVRDNRVRSRELEFPGPATELRSQQRLAILEVDRVVQLSVDGLQVRKVLDVGTGTGIFAEAFAKLSLEVSGIDANGTLLAVGQEHVPGGDFREGLAESMPFEDGTFDLVFLGHVLHETADPLEVLKEAHRVARQRVAVLEWPYQMQPYGPPLRYRLPPTTVRRLAAEAGYGVVEVIRLKKMDFYRLTP